MQASQIRRHKALLKAMDCQSRLILIPRNDLIPEGEVLGNPIELSNVIEDLRICDWYHRIQTPEATPKTPIAASAPSDTPLGSTRLGTCNTSVVFIYWATSDLTISTLCPARLLGSSAFKRCCLTDRQRFRHIHESW